MSIPYFSLGESGLPLHFLHANGYPPECYLPLITRLSEHYQVISMHQRPLWPDSRPEEITDWQLLTDDFLRFLDEHQTGASIGVGHSLGGIVTLRAALRQPEHFRALVLIDPVLFPPRVIILMRLIRAFGLSYRLHPLASGTLHRRRVFNNRDLQSKSYRHKPIFRYMNDTNLENYVNGLTCLRPDGKYELVYSPEWEAHIYITGIWNDLDLWHNLPGLKIPLLIIRGAETDTFWSTTARRVLRKVPSAQILTLEHSTHLVPLELPDEVYQAIQEFLQENL